MLEWAPLAVLSIFPVRDGASNPWSEVGSLFQDVGWVMVLKLNRNYWRIFATVTDHQIINYNLSCHQRWPQSESMTGCPQWRGRPIKHGRENHKGSELLKFGLVIYNKDEHVYGPWLRWVHCLVAYYHIIVLNIGWSPVVFYNNKHLYCYANSHVSALGLGSLFRDVVCVMVLKRLKSSCIQRE